MADLGPVDYGRDDRQTRPFNKAEMVQRLVASAPERIAGLRVAAIDKLDGVRYRFDDGGWLLIRPSGTEPLLRVYAEARDGETVHALLEAGAALAEK